MWGCLVMQLMHRNLQTVWYALWQSKASLMDGNYETGDYTDVYSDPVEMRCNVSAERSYALQEAFGPIAPYERVIVTSDMECPVDETSVFWIDVPKTDPYNYRVRRVAKSLNHISITVRKVDICVPSD